MKKKIFQPALSVSIIAVLLFAACTVMAQKKITPHNTDYFVTYPNTVTARIFVSKKLAPLTMPTFGGIQDLEYRPNTNLNLGIGATYNNFTVNLSGAINKTKEKGKTKGLDFQFHLYPTKLAVDFIAIFHKGYYIQPKGYGTPNLNSYYIRPDIKTTTLGLNVYRVPNASKFSYKAAFVQNEWQKKSAGSLLYGGEAYYVSFTGDSALVPTLLQSLYPQKGIKKVSSINVGPGIGYAYTLVMAEHFFATASLVGNLDLNYTTEHTVTEKNNKFTVQPSIIYKGVLGYNSSTWSLTGNILGDFLYFRGKSSSKEYRVESANYRITLARKFRWKK